MMNSSPRTIRRRDLLGVFIRSILIQASWSFERMQSLGFAFAMLPALRRLHPDAEEYRARLNLHMEYFNTQPYLASFILGAAVKIEEERVAGVNSTADVSALKNTLMAPLGALGDSFFWGAFKPLCALAAAALLLAGVWWAPLFFLVLYNCVHLWIRADLLLWGYRRTGDVMSLISRYPFTRTASLLKAISLAALGGLLGMLPLWTMEFKPDVPVPDVATAFAALVTTLGLTVVFKRGGSPVKFMLGLAAVCIALAYAGVA